MRAYRLLSCLAAMLLPAAAAAQSLAELEAWARESAAEVRLADAELQGLEHRLAAVEAETGARVFGSAALADVREPVTDDLRRDYRRGSAQLGVRWPLLGAREAQQRAVLQEQAAVQQARLRRELARAQVRRLVRLAYLEAASQRRRVELSRAFLSGRPEAEDALRRRRDAHLLFESDRLDFLSMFDTAQRELLAQQAARDEAHAVLRRLAGRPLPGLRAADAALEAGCLAPSVLYAAVEHRPAVMAAYAAVQAQEHEMAAWEWAGVDAGVSLSQSFSRDVGGSGGRSTAVAVDLSLPLGWQRARDARRAESRAALERARLELERRRSEHAAAVDAALAEQRVRDAGLQSTRRQLQAAQEAWRIASLRAQRLEGDMIERALQARYALYRAALQHEDSRLRHQRAQVELLLLADQGCPVQAGATDEGSSVAAVLAATVAPAAARQPVTLDWFVWRAAPWLGETGAIDRLPHGSRRLFLSFTGAEIAQLREPAAARALRDLLAAAHARGLRVHLLLGEPTWVLPEARPELLALLEQLRHFEFDAVNLDLERSQLPPAAQGGWGPLALQTLAAVKARAPWPVVLTTHYRELRDADFLHGLRAAGVQEVVAMIYAARRERVAELVQPLLAMEAAPTITVAQSIERELPATESVWRRGRAQALRHWDALARDLSASPRFGGIAVQSLEEFLEAPP